MSSRSSEILCFTWAVQRPVHLLSTFLNQSAVICVLALIWWSILYMLQHETICSLFEGRKLALVGYLTSYYIVYRHLFKKNIYQSLILKRRKFHHRHVQPGDAVTGRLGWNLREAHFLPYLWMLHLSLWRGTWGSSHACACGWSDVPLTGSAAAHQHRKRDVKGCVQLCDTRDDFLS